MSAPPCPVDDNDDEVTPTALFPKGKFWQRTRGWLNKVGKLKLIDMSLAAAKATTEDMEGSK